MGDQDAARVVAKILARAGSDNENEAKVSLQSAYKRMKRDNVTLPDLLTLPIEELYQASLVKLVDLILDDEKELSPSGKREAYSQYMLLIAYRFSGQWDGSSSSETEKGSPSPEQAKTREEQAREYEKRRQDEERRRGNGASASSSGNSQNRQNRENSASNNFRENTTPSWDNFRDKYKKYVFNFGKAGFSFSPAPFFFALKILFGRESIGWYTLHQPGRALRLYAACFLYGCAFSGVILLIACTLHALTGTNPLWDVQLKNAFSFVAAIGFIFKARLLFLAGWFR